MNDEVIFAWTGTLGPSRFLGSI